VKSRHPKELSREKTTRELLRQYRTPVPGEVAAGDRNTSRAYSLDDCVSLILALAKDDGRQGQSWAGLAREAKLSETTVRRIIEDHKRGCNPLLDQAAWECGYTLHNRGRLEIVTVSQDSWRNEDSGNPPHIANGDRMQEGGEYGIAANAETRTSYLLAQLTEEIKGIRSDLEGDAPRSAALERLRSADSLVAELRGLGDGPAAMEAAEREENRT